MAALYWRRRRIALVHDFILISTHKFNEISSNGIYKYKESHPDKVVQLNDDMFGYMGDTLKWIETVNLDRNESALGFNYYGRSIIEKKGAKKLTKLLQSWYQLFSEAPEEVMLTGWYTWNDDEDPRATGVYETLSLSREEILATLSGIIEFSTTVESGDYVLIYLGI